MSRLEFVGGIYFYALITYKTIVKFSMNVVNKEVREVKDELLSSIIKILSCWKYKNINGLKELSDVSRKYNSAIITQTKGNKFSDPYFSIQVTAPTNNTGYVVACEVDPENDYSFSFFLLVDKSALLLVNTLVITKATGQQTNSERFKIGIEHNTFPYALFHVLGTILNLRSTLAYNEPVTLIIPDYYFTDLSLNMSDITVPLNLAGYSTSILTIKTLNWLYSDSIDFNLLFKDYRKSPYNQANDFVVVYKV